MDNTELRCQYEEYKYTPRYYVLLVATGIQVTRFLISPSGLSEKKNDFDFFDC